MDDMNQQSVAPAAPSAPQPSAQPTGSKQDFGGGFIGRAYDIYQEMFKKFFAVYGEMFKRYFLVIIGALGAQVAAAFMAESNPASAGILSVVSLLFSLAMIYFYIWVEIAFLHMVKDRTSIKPVNEILADAKPKIWEYFTTNLHAGIRVLLWTLLLIIPGIIMGVYYAFAQYIFVDKGTTNGDAVKASKQLVEGYWLDVFLRFFLMAIVLIVPVMIISIVLNLFLPKQFESVTSFIVSLFVMPYAAAYGWLMYSRLKEIKGV